MNIQVFVEGNNQAISEFEAEFIPPLNSFLHYQNGAFVQVVRIVIPVPPQRGGTANLVQVVVQNHP